MCEGEDSQQSGQLFYAEGTLCGLSSPPVTRASGASARTQLSSASLYTIGRQSTRWKDEEFWPAFRDALRREHPSVTDEALDKAREYNSQRYYYQGIGRFAPAAAYARGLADLQVLADLVPPRDYMFGPKPTSVDASIYGFIANIYFYSIET
ncbi:MAG: glutathione S-transferase C-terminal domain-containing protein, partial [Steroidobacteraceae bacterium]